MKVDCKKIIISSSLMARKHPPLFRYFVLMILSLFVFLTGCATTTVRLPNVQEEEALQLKNKSIVLLRLVADLEGKPLDPCADYGRNGFQLELANIDEDEHLNSIDSVVSPTPKARDSGWIYLVLKPGTYYLSVIPPGSKQSPQAITRGTYSIQGTYGWCRRTYPLGRSANSKFEPIPPFWFHIPADSPVVYVGSLSVSCMGRQEKFSTYISECAKIIVTNESDSAKKIAQVSFSQYGMMSTSLMKQYGKSVAPFIVGELVPMGIKITPLSLMKQDKRSKTEVDVTNMDRSPSTMNSIAKGSLVFTGAMCLEFVNLLCWGQLCIPGEPTYRLMDNFFKDEVRKRQDLLSIQELPKPTDYLDPTATLFNILKEMLPSHGVHQTVELISKNDLSTQASIQKLKTLLQAEILRVQLRLCEISSYCCVELAIRIQLLDISTNKYLYDGILLSTNPFGRDKYFRRSFVIPIFESSDCRKIEDYYGEEGQKVINEEITKALELSIEKVCQDLGLKP